MGQAATDTEWSQLHLSQIFVELIYIKAEVQMAWISFPVGGNNLNCDTLHKMLHMPESNRVSPIQKRNSCHLWIDFSNIGIKINLINHGLERFSFRLNESI